MNNNSSYKDKKSKQINLKTSQIYSILRAKSELDSRATFLLLTSLVLIGLSLTSKKPDTVQILGFSLQAESWLILAVPLVLVVVYAIIDLVIAWHIELQYFNHAIYFPIIEINREICSFQSRLNSRMSILVKRAACNCFKGATCYYLKVAINNYSTLLFFE